MSDAKLSVAVLQRVSEFLSDLPAEHLVDLAEGKARLSYVPVGASAAVATPAPARRAPTRRAGGAPAADMTAARDALEAMASRDAGRAYLAPLRLKPELVSLAGMLGLGGVSGVKKADLIDRIVERAIGYRLNSSALRQL
jgi:hypothetical protein